MKKPAYVGIDPGRSGAIAVYAPYSETSTFLRKLDVATDRDVWEFFTLVDTTWDVQHACIENVHAGVFRRGGSSEGEEAGPRRQGSKSAFTFGVSTGGLRMALIAIGWQHSHVSPQRWQRVLGCMTRGDKNVSKRRAQELFPDTKGIIHATADALLLAHYTRFYVCTMGARDV